MRKSMLSAGLMTVLCVTGYAEKDTRQIATSTPGVQLPASDSIQTPHDSGVKTPTTTTTTTTTTTQSVPTPGTQPATNVKTTAPVGQKRMAKPQKTLNCTYRIPAETTRIEPTIVMQWSVKAAEQSFNFDPANLEKQIAALKACYTEQGWQGFSEALEKSGNLTAIRSQRLVVSSMVNGEGKITEVKDNQWKISVPMQVVYQNDKEKLTQPLTVNLVVGRKVSGDLGIMQMIAVPRQTTPTKVIVTPTPAGNTTPTPVNP